MIIEGSTHNNAANLARYLLRAKDGETPTLWEMRGAASDDLTEALTDWQLCARTLTKGQKVMMHSHIRLRDGEALNEAQWHSVIADLEEKLGLQNCPRAIVGHNGEKGLHVHVAWSRLDAETEKLAPLHQSRKAFHSVARAAEIEHGLERVEFTPAAVKERRNRRKTDAELKAFRDKKINKEKLQKRLTTAWNLTEDGAEFHAMVKALGYDIIRGDRRDFVIELDGLKINPVRLLEGVTEADFRERMKTAEIAKGKASDRDKISTAIKGRKAEGLIKGAMVDQLANDEKAAPAKHGFTKRKRKGPQPQLKMKRLPGPDFPQ